MYSPVPTVRFESQEVFGKDRGAFEGTNDSLLKRFTNSSVSLFLIHSAQNSIKTSAAVQ